MDEAGHGDSGPLHVRSHHIKKRALKNKSLSVSFNEKELKDYVTGFHKRKKKRRKEAMQQQEEAARRKRIELRKKRKLERHFVMFGEVPPESGNNTAAEFDDEHEDDEDNEPIASVSGTTMYDNGDMEVTVTTSEITHEEEIPSEFVKTQSGEGGFEKSKQKTVVIRKKLIKKVQKKRSRAKPQSKRDKRKGKKKNNKN